MSGSGEQEKREREEAFKALVAAIGSSFSYLETETAGGQPMLRIIHRGAIYNLVLSRSREQAINGDWK